MTKHPQMTSNSLRISLKIMFEDNADALVKRCDLFISWPIMASSALNPPPKVLPQPQDFP